MSGVSLLVVLLVLAYLGSVGSQKGFFSTHSYALYLLLGFLLGPSVLGLLESEAIADFGVVQQVGASWLALIVGLRFQLGRRSVARLISATTSSLFLAAVTGACTYVAVTRWWLYSHAQALLLSIGVACLHGATHSLCRPALGDSADAQPPVSRALRQLSTPSTLVAVPLLAAVLALGPDHGLIGFGAPTRVFVTLGTGVVLGVLGAALLGREFRSAQSFGLLLGMTLLGSGAANRVGLSTVALCFTLGLALNAASRQRDELRALLDSSESAVVLPVALLTGASVKLLVAPALLALGLLALRLVLHLFVGNAFRAVHRDVRPSGALVGLVFLMPGSWLLAATVELSSIGNGLGPVLLTVGVILAALGEIVALPRLTRILSSASEMDDEHTSPTAAATPGQPETSDPAVSKVAP